MVSVVLAPGMRAYTGGQVETEIDAVSYRAAVRELQQQFPELPAEMFEKCSVAIDGVQVHTPLLETFEADSELVFIPLIAGG
jgi:molybdopterin converting factor small subunit